MKGKFREELKLLRIKNFAALTLAGIIYAIGVTIFIAPVDLYDSGISGTSMLLGQITPSFLHLSFFLIALNVPLFLYGLRRQGLAFTVYSIWTVGVYALCAWLITDILPVDVSIASPLAGQDLLLCAIFGGVISGAGSGLAIRFGGAVDGIEVISVIFAKRIGLTVGSFMMIYNVILYVICGAVIHSWTLPLYSIVTCVAALKTVDAIVEGFDRAKCAMIVTTKPVEIGLELSEAFESGVTQVEARGGYSQKEKAIIYFVVNRFQVTKMKSIVHSVDPKAYITISEVADIIKAVDNE